MQRYSTLELSVGAFMLLGGMALAYLAFTLGDLTLGAEARYPVTARFSSVGDLKVGDSVKMAGVMVGEVKLIRLADFVAEAELSIDQTVKLPADTIASIQSAGLLGDAYVSLSPGASEDDVASGGRITRTEPALSITELISKYAFGSALGDEPEKDGDDAKRGQHEPTDDGGERPSPFDDPLE